MRFPYRRYAVESTPAQPSDQFLYRPVIPFRLTGPRGSFDYFGLLDTGADETFVTSEMAEQLGIVPNSQTFTVQSASGDILVTYGEVTIEVEQGADLYRWPVVVGIAPEPWPEAILGHAGFLDYFDITFLGMEKSVSIVRNALPLSTVNGH